MPYMSRETIMALFVFYIICLVVFKLETLTVIKQYFYLYWKVCKLFAFWHSLQYSWKSCKVSCIKLKTNNTTLNSLEVGWDAVSLSLRGDFPKVFMACKKINKQIAFSIPTAFLRNGYRCCRGDTVRPVDLPDFFRDCLFKTNHIQKNIGKNHKMVCFCTREEENGDLAEDKTILHSFLK